MAIEEFQLQDLMAQNNDSNNNPSLKDLPEIPISRAISQESMSSTFENLWTDTNYSKIAEKYQLETKSSDRTLLNELQSLFATISSKKKRIGVHGPKEFVGKLKSQNGSFKLNKKYLQEQCSKMLMKCLIT